MKKSKKGILILIIILIIILVLIFGIKLLNIFSNFNFKNITNSPAYTFFLLGSIFANLLLGLFLGDNLIKNFERIIEKKPITKSLIIEVIILLVINVCLYFIDIPTLSLAIKALVASLIFGPILDNYQESAIKEKVEYKSLSQHQIEKIDPNINNEKIKKIVFDIFKNVEKAYMYSNYEDLKKYTSEEFYNTCKKELKELESKNQRDIVKNINYLDSKILNINIKDNVEKIEVYLNISKRDYIIDTEEKKIVKGDKNIIYNIEYLVTLIRNTKDINEELDNSNVTNDINLEGFVMDNKEYLNLTQDNRIKTEDQNIIAKEEPKI